MSIEYGLFISHSWAYNNSYKGLVKLIDKRPYFRYKNYSVPIDDPIHSNGTDRELYLAIKDQIWPCHVVLILAGVYASYSKWIDKEIKIAKKEFSCPKPILAIEPFGAENTSILAKCNADMTVKWNTESIIKAIREMTR